MRARVRMARHVPGPEARYAQRRFRPHRLIFATGDRSPRSPRKANALGLTIRGFFISGVRKGSLVSRSKPLSRLHRAPEASGHLLARGRENREALHAPCLDASARAAAGCTRNELAFLTRRQCGAPFERSTAAWVHSPIRCARHCRGVCRGSQESVPRTTLAQLGRAANSFRRSPVRIRHVTTG